MGRGKNKEYKERIKDRFPSPRFRPGRKIMYTTAAAAALYTALGADCKCASFTHDCVRAVTNGNGPPSPTLPVTNSLVYRIPYTRSLSPSSWDFNTTDFHCGKNNASRRRSARSDIYVCVARVQSPSLRRRSIFRGPHRRTDYPPTGHTRGPFASYPKSTLFFSSQNRWQ